MDAVDLLNSDIAELPRTERTGTYGSRLRVALETFVREAQSLTATDFASQAILASLPRICALCDHLLAAHEATLLGHLQNSHAEMSAALTSVSAELGILRSRPLDRAGMGYVFRLREAAYSENVDRGGIFHIPFDLRSRVEPKRFSVLGLPMLYLGSTLFVCWEEMNRPAFDRVWVAAFRLRETAAVRILDFGYRPALIAALLQKTGGVDSTETRFALAHAVLWPLVAACSFPRQNATAPFVEEYILPQLVVAVLVERGDFDGIRYFSNRVHGYGGEFLSHNFVFPAQPGPDNKYCPRLAALFEVTPPMPLPMVKLLGAPINHGKPLLSSRTGIIEIYSGHPVAYQHTEFAEIESYLTDQQFAPVC